MANNEVPKRKLADLAARSSSAVVYALIVIACLYFGSWPLLLMLSVFSTVCAFELIRMMSSSADKPYHLLCLVFVAISPFCIRIFGEGLIVYSILALCLILLTWHVFDTGMDTQQVAVALFAYLYCGVMFFCLFLIRDGGIADVSGRILAFALVLSVWANDIFAYFFGCLFGKHKMMPRISPKKSWEGFIAGILGAMLVWLGFALFACPQQLPLFLFFGLICAFGDVLGDLAESRIKRVYGVKDSGSIMPGHGGLLDRCDSMIFVSALLYPLIVLAGVVL